MSRTSRKEWESGDESDKRSESGKQELIRKQQKPSSAKGE